MRSALALGLLVSAALAQTVRADGAGLIYYLPDDGASVSYDFASTIPNGNGNPINLKWTLKLSSVGQTTVDDEKCRWIEVKTVHNPGPDERVAIAKFLIPEKHLGKGKVAAEHIIRGWVKFKDEEPQAVKDAQGFNRGIASGVVSHVLGDEDVKTDRLGEVEIENKLGKLECAGVIGVIKKVSPDGQRSVENTFERRLHKKALFGVVSGVNRITLNTELTTVVKFSLTDTSTTALSELPKQK